MTDSTLINTRIQESLKTKKLFLQDEAQKKIVLEIANKITNGLKNGNTVFFAGNGGSFSDASHLAGELVCRFLIDRETLPAIALGGNNSVLTAIGNDYSYQDIFSRELAGLGKKGDIFIAISTSGNSPNIVKAVKTALQKEITTYGFTGQKGGELKKLCQCFQVPSTITARVQEIHILAGHIICEIVEKNIFNY